MKQLFLIGSLLLTLSLSAQSNTMSQMDADELGYLSTPSTEVAADDSTSASIATFPCKMTTYTVGKKVYNVADIADLSHVYREAKDKSKCFFVISKQEFRLYVYEVIGTDTVLDAHYPICYARYEGPKTQTGDSRTPECSMKHPFRISQICDSHAWAHDFKDGRGSFPAYGAWFLRLDLSQSDCAQGCRTNRSIGIHGSTGNRPSVPGRDSEGCIRLRDEDIKDLKTRYVMVGTRVVVKPSTKGKFPFEVRAEEHCADYKPAHVGYKTF